MSVPPNVQLGPLAEIFKNFAAKNGVKDHSDVEEKESSSYKMELRKIDMELKRSGLKHTGSAVNLLNTSGSGANFVPSFYLEKTNPIYAAAKEAVRDVARSKEVTARFEILGYWDNVVLSEVHKRLTDEIDVRGGKLAFPIYNRVCNQIKKWREAQGKTLSEELTNLAELCGIKIPELDASIFLACPRDPMQCVEGTEVLKVIAKQVALFKTESELMIIDAGNTGAITEDELESYIADLIESVPTLEKLEADFHPFYCCGALRHILWVHDPTQRGRVKITDLMRSGLMDEWLDVQLSPQEIPRNWFSASIATQLYEKFLALDSRGEGMLTLSDLLHYKQGIPSVVDDGLPKDVSPISELFIERVFETTKMYNGEMDYKKFVDFVVAIEFLPQCHRPLFFWHIFDLHDDGFITPVIVNYFFRETHAKLVTAGVQPPPMELIVQELFDIVHTAEPLVITKEEFLISPNQAGLLSALIINCLTFWTYETREGK